MNVKMLYKQHNPHVIVYGDLGEPLLQQAQCLGDSHSLVNIFLSLVWPLRAVRVGQDYSPSPYSPTASWSRFHPSSAYAGQESLGTMDLGFNC